MRAGEGIEAAAYKASNGADTTKSMSALAGRSNYISADLLRDVADPGATAVAIAFQALK